MNERTRWRQAMRKKERERRIVINDDTWTRLERLKDQDQVRKS